VDSPIPRHGRVAVTTACLGLVAALLFAASAWGAGPRPITSQKLVRSHSAFRGDVRTLPHAPQPARHERPEREPPLGKLQPSGAPAPIGAGTSPTAELPAPAPLSSFEGLQFSDDCGGIQCGDGHPPDTNGDVGPGYYIESVNTAVGIYDKSTGSRIAGFSFNALMSQGQFGNLCDTDNFGDPVVLYDSFHDRWVITDFAFQLDSHNNVVSPPGSFQCFAVSRTGDPVAGGWNFYSLPVADALQDYPKFGVWPDGLYMSANMFGFPANGSFQNVRVWALNLAQMEAGATTPQTVMFNAPAKTQATDVFTLLPSNARVQAGTPPAGRPNLFASVWGLSNSVRVWAFHVDWVNTANSTFTGPTDAATGSTWAPPPNTVPSKSGNALDTLAIRLMMQNQYTNIGGVESLWDSHTVQGSSSSQAAVRWYQVPVTGGTVGSALQASTWNPDASNRFMPSLAVDRAGDMALGYSVSSSTLFPAIRYAGRVVGDPANTLGQSETSLIEGSGSQFGNCGGSACTRWGDYSAMTLDPDGCTFWYANEYYSVLGLDDHTRIGSFALPGCTGIAMGTLQGTVTDASTSSPIQGAVVTAGIRSTTTNASGAYSFPNMPAGTYSVTATRSGYSSGSASGVVVNSGTTTSRDFALTATAPPAAKLAFTSLTASVASGATKTLTVEVRDASNNLVTSDNSTVVTFAQTAGSGSVMGLGTATASGGVASKVVTGATAGSVTVTATATGLSPDSSTFSVTAGTAAKVVFTSSTTSVASGATKTLTAQVRDASNNLVSSDNSTVVTFAQTAGSGSVTGLGTATASGGVASKTVTGATAGPVTITASASGLTSDTSSFSVTVGPATKVVFTSSTTSVASGATKTLTAQVRDANNNLVTSDNSTVVTFAQTSGTGSVTGLGTATASGGVASKVVTGATAGPVTITASASGLTSDTSSFSVTVGPATKVVFASSTASVASGATKTLTVEVRDANDNLVTTDNSTAVDFAQTSGSGSVSGLGTATASGGIAQKTVTGVAGGSVTITASAIGLTSATSVFTVTPGAASKLVFTSSTASVASGATKTLTVEVRDANNNLEASDNSTVVTFGQTSGTGSVTGLGTATASGGVAQKTVTGATVGSVTVTASASGLTSATSAFSVTQDAASQLAFTSSTTSVASGATKTLTVEVRDTSNNVVTSDNSTVVTFVQTSGTGSVTSLGTATASGGVASKAVTGAGAGGVTISATATGLTSDSSTFSVTPGAASRLVFTSPPSSVASGTTKLLTVEVRDTSDNVVTTDNTTAVTFAQTAGSGSVTAPGTATAAVGGVAQKTVTGAHMGPVTIAATASGLTGATISFDVLPGAADHLVFTRAPDVISGSAVDLTVEVRDANDNVAATSPTAVAFRQTSGAGTVSGLGSSVAAAGVATNHVTGVTAGPVTIAATAAGLAPISTAFMVLPGAADHVSFTSPTATLASGAQRQVVAEIRDANENRVSTSFAAITFTKTAGAGTVLGLPAAVMPLAGVAGTSVTGLAGGPVTITAAATGLRSGTTRFTVAPGPARRTIALKQAGRKLSGRVRSKPSACTNKVQLTLQIRSHGKKRWRALTRLHATRRGSFKLRIRRAASYRAVAPLIPGCASARSKTLNVRRLPG
jgi:hypothetical protein